MQANSENSPYDNSQKCKITVPKSAIIEDSMTKFFALILNVVLASTHTKMGRNVLQTISQKPKKQLMLILTSELQSHQ